MEPAAEQEEQDADEARELSTRARAYKALVPSVHYLRRNL